MAIQHAYLFTHLSFQLTVDTVIHDCSDSQQHWQMCTASYEKVQVLGRGLRVIVYGNHQQTQWRHCHRAGKVQCRHGIQ